MIVFYPSFVDPHNATHYRVADHVDYVAARCGKKHVGLGSDFDGMRESVAGLEDASKFPNLVSSALPPSKQAPDRTWLIYIFRV